MCSVPPLCLPEVHSALHSRSLLLHFVNVTFFDEEVVYFAGLVHVYLYERACLRQPEAALPLALIQQGLFVLEVRAGHEAHHLAQLRDKRFKKKREENQLIVIHPIILTK